MVIGAINIEKYAKMTIWAGCMQIYDYLYFPGKNAHFGDRGSLFIIMVAMETIQEALSCQSWYICLGGPQSRFLVDFEDCRVDI